MKKWSILLVAALMTAAAAQASFTVATFANPSTGSTNPLFWVNWTALTVNGGWTGSNLTLDFTAYNGNSFDNVWFEMDQVQITYKAPGVEYGLTGGGQIRFYAEGTNTDPLLVLTFNSGEVRRFSFGSDDVTFSGSQINGTLSDEQFSFAFAARASINGGFSATAAFDASAIPEPATLAIFGIGSVMTLGFRRKRI